MRKFAGYFIDSYLKAAEEVLDDGPIDLVTIQGEKGQRVLRMQGKDCGEPFELVAHEQGPNFFSGTWQYGKEYDERERTELKLYGDPEGEFVLIGDYWYDGIRYSWACELSPSDD